MKKKKCFIISFSETWISGRRKGAFKRNEQGPENLVLTQGSSP